jgi:hypothetical protein
LSEHYGTSLESNKYIGIDGKSYSAVHSSVVNHDEGLNTLYYANLAKKHDLTGIATYANVGLQ